MTLTRTAIALVFILAAPAQADPLALFGVGGSLRPLRGGHRTIRMVEEEVRVKLPERKVEARYVFRNQGPATTVTMGFPESGQTGDAGKFPKAGFLRGFQSFVDGRRVPVSRVVLDKSVFDQDLYESVYAVLWVKRVRFGRGQTRVLRDVYQSGRASEMTGGPESGARQLFSYVLQTGASWKGPIGRVRVVFDVTALRAFSDVKFTAPGFKSGFKKSSGKIVWNWRNVEPKSDIGASWWPGFGNIFVNGQRPFARCIVVGQRREQGEYDAVYPQRRGAQIWLPLRLLKEWLSNVTVTKEATLSQAAVPIYMGLGWGDDYVDVVIGSRFLNVRRGVGPRSKLSRVAMPAPAFFQNGAAMVELVSIVRALGGQAAWDAKTMQMKVSLR